MSERRARWVKIATSWPLLLDVEIWWTEGKPMDIKVTVHPQCLTKERSKICPRHSYM